jgi:hypothetical protein
MATPKPENESASLATPGVLGGQFMGGYSDVFGSGQYQSTPGPDVNDSNRSID